MGEGADNSDSDVAIVVIWPGAANKVTVGIAGDPPFFCYLRPFGRPMAVLSVAGDTAAMLGGAGPAAMTEAAANAIAQSPSTQRSALSPQPSYGRRMRRPYRTRH